MAGKTIAVVLQAVTGPYQAAMARAAATTKSFGSGVQAASGQVGGMAQSTGLLNAKMLGAAGAVYGMKQVAGAAIRWESAFTGVRKTVDGTEAQLSSLERGLRDLSVEMGISSTEVAGVAEAAGQLGISTGGIEAFTETMLQLGETTNLSADQAATSLARFANIMGTAESDLDTVGSVIVDLGNSMATTESEIVEMAMRLAGAGRQANLTEGEVLGLAGALSSVGIEAEAGGSALSRTMIEISSQVETGGDKVATFARVAGMSADEFATAWRTNAAGALQAFIEGLGGMEGASGSALLALEELEITDIRQRDALLRLSSASDVVADALSRQAEETADADALTEEWNKRLDTTEKRLERARMRADDLKTTVGESLTPVVGDLADQLDRVAGFEMPGGLEFGNVFATGLGAGLSSPFNPVAGGAAIFENLDEQRMAQEADAAAGQLEALSMAHDWLTEKVDQGAAALTGWLDRAGEATGATGGLVGAQGDLAMYVKDSNDNLRHQLDLFAEMSADPVDRLISALDDVEEAQTTYTEAVAEFGEDSPEAADAAWELFQANMSAAQAADEATGKYGDVEAAVVGMYEAGLINNEQMKVLLGLLEDTQREAATWERTYTMILDADLSPLQRKLAGLRNQGFHVEIPGIVGAGGITMHTGGIVGGSAGMAPGLAPDERLRVLQVGERVVSAQSAGAHGSQTSTAIRSQRNLTIAEGAVQILTRDAHTAAREVGDELAFRFV